MSTKLAEELKKKTVFELKSYAKKNNIDLFGANTKAEILEVILCFVPRVDQVQEKKNKKESPKEKVALYSSRNLHWNGVGDLKVGYNILAKEESERWLKHKAVRIANADEVARYYGK